MGRLARDSERRSEIYHERELAAIRAESRALVWTGTQAEFVQAILKLYESGCLLATDATDALLKASMHFVRADGTAIIRPQEASSAPLPAKSKEKPKPSRESFVKTILDSKGWSIFDWANEANVSHATAIDYLHGKTKPHPSTRLKLATALGITAQQLPM
jgi:hypothetical protein